MPAGYDFITFTGANLHVPDDYKSLCLKTRAICRFAAFWRYDWMVKVDDDVFVRAERLKPPEADYAGHVLPGGYCAGSFYWLSRDAIQILAAAPIDPRFNTSAEDQWVGKELALHGIKPVDLSDVAFQPCGCGICKPEPVPAEWTSYSLWYRYSTEAFLDFEEKYG